MSEEPKRLSELIAGINSIKIIGTKNPLIKGITYDSRKVEPGYIFCCIKGERLDGNDFISEAISRGAVSILTENVLHINVPIIESKNVRKTMGLLSSKFYDAPSSKLKTFGITGTKGKTTISYLLYQALGGDSGKVCLSSTVGMFYNNRYEYSFRTTPESPELQFFLKDALKNGCEYAVIEISSHALSQDRTIGLELDIAGFTNLYAEHLEYHKDIDDYFKAKSKIIELIKENGRLIVNIDNNWGERLYNLSSQLSHIKVLSISSRKRADIRLSVLEAGKGGTTINITSDNYSLDLSSQIKGSFNIENIAMASAILLESGCEPETVIEGLNKAVLPPGRMEEVDVGQSFRVIIDYAHTPESIEMLLRLVKTEVKDGKLITVFGATGDRFKMKRPKFGKIISELSDIFIITTDDPYNENPIDIASDVIKGVEAKRKHKVEIILERGRAIEKALSIALSSDIVIIAGKGHERFIIYSDKKVPFSDREFTEKALKRLMRRARTERE